MARTLRNRNGVDVLGGTNNGGGTKALLLPPPPPSNQGSIVEVGSSGGGGGKPGGIAKAGGGEMGGRTTRRSSADCSNVRNDDHQFVPKSPPVLLFHVAIGTVYIWSFHVPVLGYRKKV